MKSGIKIIIALCFLLQIFQTGGLYPQYVSDFMVNDDIGNAYQGLAALDVDTAGNFVVVWMDERDTSGYPFNRRIYCQQFNKFGIPQGNNFKIENTVGRTPTNFSIVKRHDGSFIVAWDEGRIDSNVSNYKMRIYNKYGQPISSAITINDSITITLGGVSNGVDKFGNSFIVMRYASGIQGNYNVYLQRFDALGNKIGSNQLVNDDINSSQQEKPEINKSFYNKFIITWEDNRIGWPSSGVPDIFMQIYDSNGVKIGANRKVNDDNHHKPPHYKPSYSSDPIGKFTITWLDSRETLGSDFLVYSQNYNPDGSLNGANYRVDQGLIYSRGNPKVRIRKDGYYVIGWYDRIYGPMFQRFNDNHQFIGEQKSISLQNNPNEKIFQDITISGDRVISIWQDLRNGNYDIYCNIRSFNNPDSIISSVTTLSNEIPSEFKLFQNHPNPFNPSTKIEFSLPKFINVVIKIFDINGREVKTLVNEKLNAGKYKADWHSVDNSGARVSSGVYFYKITAGNFTETKKMIIVK